MNGMPRIKGLKPDDLVLTFDADEIPNREVSFKDMESFIY